MDEPRLDNDANHERDWGGAVGPNAGRGASDVRWVASGAEEAGEMPASVVDGGCGIPGQSSQNLRVGNASLWASDPRAAKETERITRMAYRCGPKATASPSWDLGAHFKITIIDCGDFGRGRTFSGISSRLGVTIAGHLDGREIGDCGDERTGDFGRG